MVCTRLLFHSFLTESVGYDALGGINARNDIYSYNLATRVFTYVDGHNGSAGSSPVRGRLYPVAWASSNTIFVFGGREVTTGQWNYEASCFGFNVLRAMWTFVSGNNQTNTAPPGHPGARWGMVAARIGDDGSMLAFGGMQ